MTNMNIIKRSRKKVLLGDIFSFQILEGKFHWGRVVSLSANVGGFNDCVLIYIYKTTTQSGTTAPSSLSPDDLLLAPIATNELPWRKGYFQSVANQAIKDSDLLDVHCFYDVLFKSYFDDNAKRLDRAHEPCGTYGLDSYKTIDDKLSEALNIELFPD